MPVRSPPMDGPPLSRVRARSSRLILAAARSFLDAHSLDELSMRRLADEAGVSVRTIYNVFGDKDGVITALVLQSFAAMDAALARSEATDPIERIWETIAHSVQANCRYAPRAVVAEVVSDPAKYQAVVQRWNGTRLIHDAVDAAMATGALRRDLPPSRLLEQAGPAHAQRLRQWAAGDIDQEALRAGVLCAFDLCLLAVARPPTRTRLLDHLAALEPLLPDPVTARA